MSGYHSPTPWRTEVYSPAFASIVDAEERAVVEKMFKDDAAFIVRAVNAYASGTTEQKKVLMQVYRELEYIADKEQERRDVGDPCPGFEFRREDFLALQELVEDTLTPEEMNEADRLGTPADALNAARGIPLTDPWMPERVDGDGRD